jgi:hypothetical protein
MLQGDQVRQMPQSVEVLQRRRKMQNLEVVGKIVGCSYLLMLIDDEDACLGCLVVNDGDGVWRGDYVENDAVGDPLVKEVEDAGFALLVLLQPPFHPQLLMMRKKIVVRVIGQKNCF